MRHTHIAAACAARSKAGRRTISSPACCRASLTSAGSCWSPPSLRGDAQNGPAGPGYSLLCPKAHVTSFARLEEPASRASRTACTAEDEAIKETLKARLVARLRTRGGRLRARHGPERQSRPLQRRPRPHALRAAARVARPSARARARAPIGSRWTAAWRPFWRLSAGGEDRILRGAGRPLLAARLAAAAPRIAEHAQGPGGRGGSHGELELARGAGRARGT